MWSWTMKGLVLTFVVAGSALSVAGTVSFASAAHPHVRVAPRCLCQPVGQIGDPRGQWEGYPGWRWYGDSRWHWDGYPRWLWHG